MKTCVPIGTSRNGEIVFDGKGRSLCTAQDYADFEMLVDWKIPSRGTAAFICAAVRRCRFGILSQGARATRSARAGLQ